MRFYGIPSENRVEEIVEGIKEGVWVYEDLKAQLREELSFEEAKEKLKEIIQQVREWKESFSTMSKNTIFVFVHEPAEPKAFKIYDTSSLGCSTELSPPRWKVYQKGLDV